MSLASVVSQHKDEASFPWEERTRVVHAPDYTLSELATLDQRIVANLDGLRIAGEDACVCAEQLEGPAEVFAAGVLVLENARESGIKPVLDVVSTTAELARGFISALGWLEYPEAEAHIGAFSGSRSPSVRKVGIAGAAIHRKVAERHLNEALADSDFPVQARAWRAIGELGRVDLALSIRKELNAEDTDRRFWAAWSTTLLVGTAEAIEVLQHFALSDADYGERSLRLVIRRMHLQRAHSWNEDLANRPEPGRAAINGAGIIGDPALVPWLIHEMQAPPLARIAGEAFTMIIGVDIAFQDLDADKPEGFEAGPTEDPADENVEMDQDENLPCPNPDLIAKWWRQHQHEYQNGTRYLLGRPITVEWCEQVLREGRQRQRAAAALEIAIRRPGQPLFNVAAPGFRQQEMLGIRRWRRRS